MFDFPKFADAVSRHFDEMSKNELYVVDITGDDLYNHYLASFPDGTNPIYITRTFHDCSCCKNFIRNVGNVVSIENGKLVSIWNVENAPHPYDKVAASLATLVEEASIKRVFRTREKRYGNRVTRQLLENGQIKNHDHFYCTIANRHLTSSPAEVIGEIDSTVSVFRRGLDELTIDSFETVTDLINSNSIYRGQEHSGAVSNFYSLKRQYDKLNSKWAKDLFVWQHYNDRSTRFRNTVIGTLLIDISDGVDLESAVRSFESKVAPHNYKRPTALITPKMVNDAMKTVRDLGLEDNLQRRFAKISDVTINNVLWADNTAKSQMKDSIEDVLMQAATKKRHKSQNVQEITIDDFVQQVMPKAESMDVVLNNAQLSNFMSLTAPVHENSGNLFKWNNDFGWSYDGNITDSIKERVKRAGGNVSAPFRVSLSWFNYDDLDIHARTPDNNRIYFGNKCGILDVDMNAGGGRSREPVENLAWTKPINGTYTIWVNQYNTREATDVGFDIEVENNGQIQQFSYNKKVTGVVQVGEFTLENGVIVEQKINPQLVSSNRTIEKWGVKTNEPVRVQMLMNSPNYWDENAVGNKHWFFILEGCANDTPTRGIYNEFLHTSLEKHRKVFEVLGDKTKCQPTDEQLSGAGFSSTRKDQVVAVVHTNRVSKTFKITF